MKNKIIILLILLPVFLIAKKTYEPWDTGTILAASANCLEKGKFNIQPFFAIANTHSIITNNNVFINNNTSNSNILASDSMAPAKTYQMDLFLQAGLTNWLDFTLSGFVSHRERDAQDSLGIGNIAACFGFQLMKENESTLKPSIRLIVREYFPTGKYKNLDPNKLVIDSFGDGSYDTSFNLSIGKTVYFITNHPITWRVNLYYLFSTKVKVTGFNTFGGGFGAKATVDPGENYGALFAFEYNFTQRWVFAMDIAYYYSTKIKFKGFPGLDFLGHLSSEASPPSQVIMLTPSLEFNISENLGFIAGALLSEREKNIFPFKAFVLSVSYTF